MSILPRCDRHGFTVPCPHCVIEDGWREHAGNANKTEIPPGLKHRALQQLGNILTPPTYTPPKVPVVHWEEWVGGYMANLMGDLQLNIYRDIGQGRLRWDIQVDDKTLISGTSDGPIEKVKALVLNEAKALLMGLLFQVATIKD